MEKEKRQQDGLQNEAFLTAMQGPSSEIPEGFGTTIAKWRDEALERVVEGTTGLKDNAKVIRHACPASTGVYEAMDNVVCSMNEVCDELPEYKVLLVEEGV